MSVYIDGYLIDASLTETHKLSSNVTKYPVESGAKITDHISNEPREVTIEGIVSDTPIGNVATVRASATASPTGSLDFLPSDEALAKLEALWESREPVPIQTTLAGGKSYENMALMDLDIPVDETTGHALRFTATFQQIKIVTNNRTIVRSALGTGGQKKKSAVPVIVVDDGNRGPLITNDGRSAEWNAKKGRYEYAKFTPGQVGGTTGVPVPDSQLSQAKAQANADLKERQAAEAAENNTYFDQEADEWRNTNGTPVTQQQLRGMNGTSPTQGSSDQPWWSVAPEEGNVR
jgi:hypothetical protein